MQAAANQLVLSATQDERVTGDAVNLASRIEGLTKNYRVSLLISHYTFSQLKEVNQYAFRIIDRVQVKGKSEAVSVYEIFDADPPQIREGKSVTKTAFEEALLLYNLRSFKEVKKRFKEVLSLNPEDTVAQIYLERCQDIQESEAGVPDEKRLTIGADVTPKTSSGRL